MFKHLVFYMFTQSAPTGKHLNLAKLQVFGSGRANLKTQTFKPFPRFDRQDTNVNFQKTKKKTKASCRPEKTKKTQTGNTAL